MSGLILYQIFVACHEAVATALFEATGCLPLAVIRIMYIMTSASWLKPCRLNIDHHRAWCWQTNTPVGVCKCK